MRWTQRRVAVSRRGKTSRPAHVLAIVDSRSAIAPAIAFLRASGDSRWGVVGASGYSLHAPRDLRRTTSGALLLVVVEPYDQGCGFFDACARFGERIPSESGFDPHWCMTRNRM